MQRFVARRWFSTPKLPPPLQRWLHEWDKCECGRVKYIDPCWCWTDPLDRGCQAQSPGAPAPTEHEESDVVMDRKKFIGDTASC